jgi:hypothetical protein
LKCLGPHEKPRAPDPAELPEDVIEQLLISAIQTTPISKSEECPNASNSSSSNSKRTNEYQKPVMNIFNSYNELNVDKADCSPSASNLNTGGNAVMTNILKVDSVMIKIHQFSTPTIKQTSTLMMPKHFKMCDVFSSICSKRKFDKNDYKFLSGDGKSEVPMDEILSNFKIFEFCLIKVESNEQADIIKEMELIKTKSVK